MKGVFHVDCPGCGAPMDPRSVDGHTARCNYCGAVGVVRRQGDRLVFEPTVISAAAGHAIALWGKLGVSIAGMVGSAALVLTVSQALRPSMGTPIPLAVVSLFAAAILRLRANPLLGALLALPAGVVMAAKPFVFPLRIGRVGAFSPTSETALHWVLPGVGIFIIGLIMVGTLSRARIVWSARALIPGWRAVVSIVLGVGVGMLLSVFTSRQTLFERLEASAATFERLEGRLAVAATLRSDTPLSVEHRAALVREPEIVDVLLRTELVSGLTPSATHMNTGVISELLELRRQLQTRKEDVYVGDLHEPMHDGRVRAVARAEALRYVVVVDLSPSETLRGTSGTSYTAIGTVVDLEAGVALGTLTGLPGSSAYEAVHNVEDEVRRPLH